MGETVCISSKCARIGVRGPGVCKAPNVRPWACVKSCPPHGLSPWPRHLLHAGSQPQFLSPLTRPSSQPYVHPHRTLSTIPRAGVGSCRSALALQLKGESQKGQRASARPGFQVRTQADRAAAGLGYWGGRESSCYNHSCPPKLPSPASCIPCAVSPKPLKTPQNTQPRPSSRGFWLQTVTVCVHW